jgi:hypothetical protein
MKGPVAIDAIGRKLSPDFLNLVGRVQHAIDASNRAIMQALSVLTKLRNAEMAIPVDRIDKAREELAELAAFVRAQRPVSLCPACKGIDEVQHECPMCLTCGYVTAGQKKQIPDELFASQVVLWRGKQYPIDHFARTEQTVDEWLGLSDDDESP